MARARKHVPARLGEKLKQIREHLDVQSYGEMVRRLNLPDLKLYRASILEYESNKRTPPLLVLLRYSELSGISINDMVDDRVDLKGLTKR
jgi:hypothetical protein